MDKTVTKFKMILKDSPPPPHPNFPLVMELFRTNKRSFAFLDLILLSMGNTP